MFKDDLSCVRCFFNFVYLLWMFVWEMSCVFLVEWLSLLFRCIDILGDGRCVYFHV